MHSQLNSWTEGLKAKRGGSGAPALLEKMLECLGVQLWPGGCGDEQGEVSA